VPAGTHEFKIMLSSRAKYATRALLELSLNYEEGPLRLSVIAERQHIPPLFLQQIMGSLKLGGFVNTQKGPGGGFLLAHEPGQIMLGDVVRAMDGPLALLSCVSVTRHGECGCPDPEVCGLRLAFKKARDSMAGILDNTSYEDIRRRHRENLARLDT
jgi:Rrf2 family protein